MSKRQSSVQTNTLFNYFTSPKIKKPDNKNGTDLNGSTSNLKIQDLNKSTVEDDEEEVVSVAKKKRSRIVVASDSEEEVAGGEEAKRRKVVQNNSDESDEAAENDSAVQKVQAFSFSKDNNETTTERKVIEKKNEAPVFTTEKTWLHNKLDFLQPKKIRDINKNRPDDPNYDERTLYVPEDFLNKQTPAMRQWWLLKSKHFDSVLFFKVGKFYELYHMDAVVGVNHLGFSFMKGEFAHSGFPESAYGRMATSLIEQGFKVARVEQTETPEMMGERCKKGGRVTKFDKVVRREICQISVKGTCLYGAQMQEARQDAPCYMLALAERQNDNKRRFGVCFVDVSIGVFHLAEFDDDKHCSRLLALFAENQPSLILIERGALSTTTLDVLKRQYGGVKRDVLSSGTQFYSAATTLEKLGEGCYFKNKNGDVEWPDVFAKLKNETFNPEFELVLKALGACIWYLKDSELDIQVLSMRKFEMYSPIDTVSNVQKLNRDYMVLDAVTMENLKLLGGVGTLQKVLDHCVTSFGKRLLQQWICRPLCDVQKLVERQKAVAELVDNPEILKETRAILKKLPDLERQVVKIHVFGNKFCSEMHPDTRAIFYEANTYSKRKINDLLNTLKGFEKAQEISKLFQDCQCRLLKKITQHPPDGVFADLSETLTFFKEAFDQEKAAKDGKITPQIGVDQDYDQAEAAIRDIKSRLDDYLEEQKKFFGCTVTYFGTEKKRFQLEVPENKTHKVTRDYKLEGTKRGAKPARRYSTTVTRELLADMLRAEAERAKIVQDLNRRIFEKFSEKSEQWELVTHCLMMLDVLCSLAEYARTYSEDICLPEILPAVDKPKIVIKDGRHPCITTVPNFVPNDTHLGTDDHPSILLLTGPNMGGKSTLMRQVALITIMAQIGSFVPASSCQFNVIDRVFTRLGARDDIIQGQSTFLVELLEAAAILQHATCHSLVLIDELGRGTSTHDGNAIAKAYLGKLTEMQCRTLFSTHYHNLVDSFAKDQSIQLGHMACMVENEDVEDISKQNVTFLYKLAEGSCPKSYGFNAARLAGLPPDIISRAYEIARELERRDKTRKLIYDLAHVKTNKVEILKAFKLLKI